ncbi:MAG: type II 3-dehydroquinate dehydratase [Clostridia bacterium]|nr:type II 3-dehydroquinate dehydratase [Clostridia bacterium]
MKLLVINGPNINFLGIREPEIYGKTTYNDMLATIEAYARQREVSISFFQSNHEGALVDAIQEAYYNKVDGIVINPAAYTHTSIAILDALKAVGIPTVEVHLSAVENREDFRQISYVGKYACKTITGQGVNGYLMAIDHLMDMLK